MGWLVEMVTFSGFLFVSPGGLKTFLRNLFCVWHVDKKCETISVVWGGKVIVHDCCSFIGLFQKFSQLLPIEHSEIALRPTTVLCVKLHSSVKSFPSQPESFRA